MCQPYPSHFDCVRTVYIEMTSTNILGIYSTIESTENPFSLW